MIGEVIGSYRIVSELGKGGMGMVYRAEHVQLGRPAALKMLLPQFSTDPGIVQRFFNEARAASAIDHPGIVEIYDFGTHSDGRAYIVMALLKGESLDARLRRGSLPPGDAATITAQVASALAAAHARGIVHRDLKPDNIFLVPNELVPGGLQVKLLDFGIAKLAGDEAAGVKTQTGALIGTPAYMSPEQCMGRADLDHRTDLYSLGCILFHLLCGRPPFVSDQGTGVMIAAHLRDTPPPPRTLNPGVPDALAAIVLRLLEKDPAARYQTATELRDALIAAGANTPATKPPVIDQYGATMAPVTGDAATAVASTTHSAAAAQVTAPTTSRSSRGIWIGLGAVAIAAAGVGGYVATRTAEHPPAVAAQPPPAPPSPRPEPPPTTGPAILPPAPPPARACPPGKQSADGRYDHCCWPGQTWTPAARCMNVPTCPRGMVASGYDCVADRAHVSQPLQQTATRSTRFKIDAKSYGPGATVQIKFGSPVHSVSGDQAWVTIAEAGAPESSYGTWKYLDDQATHESLVAPDKEGAYEVRLHTNYPTESFHVVHAEPFAVQIGQASTGGETPLAQQRFALASSSVAPGGDVKLAFPTALHAAQGEQFWVTIVRQGTPDDKWEAYEYVPDGARAMKLTAPDQPGTYEVRLHANYPTKTTNVVHRATLRLQ